MRRKRFTALGLAALLVLCTGCGRKEAAGLTAAGDSVGETAVAAETYEYDLEFTARDLETGYDESAATRIELDGSQTMVSGDGAVYENGAVVIRSEGTYVVSGTMKEGQLIVRAQDTDKVHIVLNGASVYCSSHAALFIEEADKTVITLAAGTENELGSGTAYSLTEEDSNVDGVIFSRGDLTLNGSGSLTVTAAYKHGIVSKDDLVITGGTYYVTAENGGIYGKDCVKIAEGVFTVESGTDAIQSSNGEEEGRGFVYIADGSFSLTAGGDGIQAETMLLVEGGTFTIDSTEDSLHSNGTLSIEDGTLTLSSEDDGIHADEELVIDGGAITVTQSYEGLEGLTVAINGGTIRVTAQDDGINSAGGSDTQTNGGGPGADSFGSLSLDSFIRITGGTIEVDAGGDGLDSNGNLYVEGGTAVISGAADNGNGALDYEGTAEISGGIVIAYGMSAMAQGFSEASGQYSILQNFSGTIAAGETITLAAEDGTVLASTVAAKAFQSVAVSCPELSEGNSYTLEAGEQSETLTLTSVVTSNGNSIMNGPGGRNGAGGHKGGQIPEEAGMGPRQDNAGGLPVH